MAQTIRHLMGPAGLVAQAADKLRESTERHGPQLCGSMCFLETNLSRLFKRSGLNTRSRVHVPICAPDSQVRDSARSPETPLRWEALVEQLPPSCAPPPTPNPVGVEQNACHTAHPAPLPPQRLAQPSLPRSNSFSSRRASLLSRRSCLSISSLIRLASFASSLRQHAIMDSRVILSPLFPETRTFPLFLLLLIHPDFQKREKEQACLKMPNSPHTGLRAGK